MSNYIDRMNAELAALVAMIEKADAYLEKQGDDLLTAQVYAMMTYASILECRLGSAVRTEDDEQT